MVQIFYLFCVANFFEPNFAPRPHGSCIIFLTPRPVLQQKPFKLGWTKYSDWAKVIKLNVDLNLVSLVLCDILPSN